MASRSTATTGIGAAVQAATGVGTVTLTPDGQHACGQVQRPLDDWWLLWW